MADLGGVRGVQMHPPLAASNVFCVHNCTSPSNDYAMSSGMQQQQPGTVTHSRISSLLISRRLTRPKVASRFSVRPEESATARLGVRDFFCDGPLGSAFQLLLYECVHVTESGRGNPKNFRRASRAPVTEPPFLNF